MRYVIQKHSHQDNPTHWDLMIQTGEKLSTWRIDVPPTEFVSGIAIRAVAIADHDVKFLDYQGSVNNGMGSVEIADKGECEIISQDGNSLVVDFTGQLLNDQWEIEHA